MCIRDRPYTLTPRPQPPDPKSKSRTLKRVRRFSGDLRHRDDVSGDPRHDAWRARRGQAVSQPL
eukprot:1395924-Rhodomonas_salina.1